MEDKHREIPLAHIKILEHGDDVIADDVGHAALSYSTEEGPDCCVPIVRRPTGIAVELKIRKFDVPLAGAHGRH